MATKYIIFEKVFRDKEKSVNESANEAIKTESKQQISTTVTLPIRLNSLKKIFFEGDQRAKRAERL